MMFEEAPEMLKVEEAAKLLRISRSSAYEAVATFQATRGADGLPSVRIGHTLRVPKPMLIAWVQAKGYQDRADGPANAA